MCHLSLHRQDVSWSAIPRIYRIGALSFADARPRGSSENDYFETDEWLFGDVLTRLRFEPRKLVFDADYVCGRMKTTVSIRPEGEFVVETRNRHEMALRWLRALKGKKHRELIE